MKRTIQLPLGEIEVWLHGDGDTMLKIGMAGDLFVNVKLTPYAAGKLAAALEDVNTNRLTVEEALAITATTGEEYSASVEA